MLLIVAGILITKGDYDDIIAMACIAMGVFLLGVLIFLAAPQRLPTGAPVTSISAGEYKVASVYVTVENVNLILEINDGLAEKPYFYQFPINAFDGGQVNPTGAKLIVVESGNFKKLKLE